MQARHHPCIAGGPVDCLPGGHGDANCRADDYGNCHSRSLPHAPGDRYSSRSHTLSWTFAAHPANTLSRPSDAASYHHLSCPACQPDGSAAIANHPWRLPGTGQQSDVCSNCNHSSSDSHRPGRVSGSGCDSHAIQRLPVPTCHGYICRTNCLPWAARLPNFTSHLASSYPNPHPFDDCPAADPHPPTDDQRDASSHTYRKTSTPHGHSSCPGQPYHPLALLECG